MAERKVEYKTLEHKADTGFLVTAPSWERLYIDAALSLTDIMVKLEHIEPKDRQTVTLSAENRESLMVRWLNDVLFLFEQQKFLARRIVFNQFDGKQILATLWGEAYHPVRHGGCSEIKAVTYHQLELGDRPKPEPHFYARIFLDL